MFKLAVVIIHNKGNSGNIAQIENIKSLVTKVVDTHQIFDDQTNQVITYKTYHYEVKNLGVPHEIYFYQIVPFEVLEPPNFNDIDSHNVIYRKGDEDKTGSHARFFNWGLKRATDYGADIVIHLGDDSKLDFKKLLPSLQKLIDKNDKTEYLEDDCGQIVTSKVLLQVGQLDESKSKSVSLANLKKRIIDKGFKNG